MKRIFAYSTLGQIGVLFIALSYGNITVVSGAIFLIALHSITKVMLFFALDILKDRFNSVKVDIFGKFRSIFLVLIFSIGFLSLLGLPPFGGFIAKLTILKGLASLEAYMMIGVILIVSLAEAVYFFRLLALTQQSSQKELIQIPLLKKSVLAFLATMIVYFGIFPDDLLGVCQNVASSLLAGAGNV